MPDQRQDSTTDQLRDVIVMANNAGCYDAADWISSRLVGDGQSPVAHLVESYLEAPEQVTSLRRARTPSA